MNLYIVWSTVGLFAGLGILGVDALCTWEMLEFLLLTGCLTVLIVCLGISYGMAVVLTAGAIAALAVGLPGNARKLLWAFSLLAAFGRLGCLFSGCCCGKLATSGLLYQNATINHKIKVAGFCVQPTIVWEALAQFAIALAMPHVDNPVLVFGVSNAILFAFTCRWRLAKRFRIRSTNQGVGFLPVLCLLLLGLSGEQVGEQPVGKQATPPLAYFLALFSMGATATIVFLLKQQPLKICSNDDTRVRFQGASM